LAKFKDGITLKNVKKVLFNLILNKKERENIIFKK